MEGKACRYIINVCCYLLATYIFLLRPRLIPTMSTVYIELIVQGIVIVGLILAIIVFLVTTLITLGVGIITRNKEKVTRWLYKLRSQIIVVVSLILVVSIMVIISQMVAYTPPILGEDGEVLENSIASLEKINIDGSDQWVTIRGENKNNPVLLFLAGGSGGTQLAATRSQLRRLEKHFVVVNWDQPGSGKSYHGVDIDTLTPECYISDGHKLTTYLMERFNKEKIYIMGESWGSALGTWLVKQYPELYHGFIGTGQMVAFEETELACYEKALEIAKDRGDTDKVNELKSQGAPPYYGDDVTWKSSTYLMYLHNAMAKNSVIAPTDHNTIKDVIGPEYGLYDKVNYFRGIVKTFNQVYQQLYEIDLRKQATELEVPVYFFIGRHDINAPPRLAEEYYNMIDAPKKELVWFEHSGHGP